MASRGQDLNVKITATDTASKVVDGVSKKVGKLEDDPHVVDLDADDDKAVATVKALDRRLDGLTAEEREFVLKAQAKQLEREVEGALKKLSHLDRYDDEEITLILEAKDKASAELQTVRAELGKVEGAAGDANEAVGEIGEGQTASLGSRFKGLGGSLGAKLVAGFAAAGVGKLISDSISKAMDIRQGTKALTGQFRITAEEAGRYSKIAGDLYAANWGDSLREVQQNVATAAQRLGEITDSELASVSEGILAVTSTWETEFDEVVRAVSQLMQNDLAPNATEALALITAAFQGGGDEADDLLDTIIEYSQHWANFGLSGENALGMIVDGFRNGQRDADKMGDVVKEMFLLTSVASEEVDAALGRLGINADDYRRKLMRGGDDAREAYNEVIQALIDAGDQAVTNGDGVLVLGTQFEDLAGLKALPSLIAIEGKLGDVDTAVQDLTTSIEATPIEIWQRRGETAAQGIGGAILDVEGNIKDFGREVNQAVRPWKWKEYLEDPIYDTGDALMDSAAKAKEFDDTLLDGLPTYEDVRQKVIELTGDEAQAAIVASEWRKENSDLSLSLEDVHDGTRDLADESRNAKRPIGDMAKVEKDLEEAAEDAAEALIEQAEAIEDLKLKTIELIGGDIALRESQRQTNDALTEYAEAAKEAKVGTVEYQVAQDAAASSVLAGAEAAVQYAADQAELNGTLFTAKDRANTMVEALTGVANSLRPDDPLRAQLRAYIAELLQIPSSVTTQLRTTGQKVTAGGDFIGQLGGRRAHGGPVTGGTPYLVGEQGPEIVVPSSSGTVIANNKIGTAGGMGAAPINLTVNVGLGAGDGNQIGRQVVNAIKQYERSNGSGWRT